MKNKTYVEICINRMVEEDMSELIARTEAIKEIDAEKE